MIPEYYAHIWDRLDHRKGRWMNGAAGFRYYKCLCPAHDDDNPSMTLRVGNNGKLIAKCHTGCRFAEIARALGTEPKEWSPPVVSTRRKNMSKLGKIVATYPYVDRDGVVVYETVRYEPKDFRQRRDARPGEGPGPNGKVWTLNGVSKILYNLPQLVDPANSLRTIFVVEGEGKVEALRELGILATCSPLGAGKWSLLSDRSPLKDRGIVVFPDYDAVDQKRGFRVGSWHAEQVANDLSGFAQWVRVVWLPGMKEGWDVKNWIAFQVAQGHSSDHIRQVIMQEVIKTPVWVKGQTCQPPKPGGDIPDFLVKVAQTRDGLPTRVASNPADLLTIVSEIEKQVGKLQEYLSKVSRQPLSCYNSDRVVDFAAEITATIWRSLIDAKLVISPIKESK